MRRALLALLTAAGIAAAIAIPATPASAVLGVDADLSVSVDSLPETVTPVGGHVVYRVTWANNGPAPSVQATMSTSISATQGAPAIVDLNGDTTGCSQSGLTVSCSKFLHTGGAQTIDIVVRTPAQESVLTNAASTTSLVFGGFEENLANNSDGATTTVTNDPTNAYAFVPPGGSISYRSATLRVPSQGTNGVFVQLADSDVDPETQCGTDDCGAGMHIGFLNVPGYGADDPNHPLVVTATTARGICNGLGVGSGCAELWKIAEAPGSTPEPVADCVQPDVADPDPCLESIVPGASGVRTYEFNMTSEDPEIMGIQLL